MIDAKWDFTWIEDAAALAEFVQLLKAEQVISVDTETVGWQTGNERLCLIQIGAPSKELVGLVDALKLSDLKALESVLSATAPAVIAHNASFEERQFQRHGIKLRGIIDTLEMSRRLRPDLPNHTLKACCKYLLDLDISKAQQASDWSRRPLSPEQLLYARLDAELAYKLYLALKALEDRLVVAPQIDVPELMRELHETIEKKFELTKEISTELAYLNLRFELLKQSLKGKLLDGEPPYQGPYGSCSITKVRKNEISPDKVRAMLPEIADLAIGEFVEKKRLMALMREHGIDEGKIEDVEDVVGFTERLNLNLDRGGED